MKALLAAALALPLAACATSAAGLAKGDVDATYSSAKAPEDVAGCLANELKADNDLFRLADGHYVLTRKNGYGIPTVRWDFIREADRTRIELRTSLPVGSGQDKLRGCL